MIRVILNTGIVLTYMDADQVSPVSDSGNVFFKVHNDNEHFAFVTDRYVTDEGRGLITTIQQEQQLQLMKSERKCRVCGCTQDNCEQCIKKTGSPCRWIEWDLCSACVKEEKPIAKRTRKKTKS